MRSVALYLVGILALNPGIAVAVEPADFERDIAPIFVNHCLDCHQRSKRAGKLNLSTLADMAAGGEQGPAIVPHKASASLLVQRIVDGEMPPPDDKHAVPLSEKQKAALTAWVAAGAAWPKDRELGIHEKPVDLAAAREFWSFQAVRRPAVPVASGGREAPGNHHIT